MTSLEYLTKPESAELNTPLFDSGRRQVGTVCEVSGPVVTLSHPSGLVWSVRFTRLRRPTESELRRLAEAAKYNRAPTG